MASQRPAKTGWPGLGESREVAVVYGLLVLLIGLTFLLGLRGVGAVRPVYIVAGVLVAWRAWKVGPGLHVEVMVFLFAFSPFLRRVVDLGAGYNPSGVMLLCPMLALIFPVLETRKVVIDRRPNFSVYMPYFMILACMLYGWAYTAFQNRLVESTTEAAKMLPTMLYSIYLMQRNDDCADVMTGASRAFMIVCPIIGAYGLFQWLTLPDWDRNWMIYSRLGPAGVPEPRLVRVYSTMNSPASFAFFAACGLLIFSYCRRGLVSLLLVVPIGVGILLSTVRMSWIAISIAVVFATLFNATRQRSAVLAVSLGGALAAALLLTPAGDVVGDRLATMGGPGQDYSANVRMHQYEYVYSNLDHFLFGNGFGSAIGDVNLSDVDGQFIMSAVSMGILIGNIHVLGIIWAAAQGLCQIRLHDGPLRVVAAAMVLSFLMLLPLQAVWSSEVSFLFWLLVGVMSSSIPRGAPDRRPTAAPRRPFRTLGPNIGR